MHRNILLDASCFICPKANLYDRIICYICWADLFSLELSVQVASGHFCGFGRSNVSNDNSHMGFKK